jgi:hypothetical protein
MWLSCATQEEIAEAVDVAQQTIVDWMKDFTETSIAEVSVKSSDFDKAMTFTRTECCPHEPPSELH